MLIKNHQAVDNKWVYFEPDLEPDEHIEGVIFNLQNYKACSHHVPETLKFGIKLANHDPANALAECINELDLIVLDFPVFSDGRAYSQAQIIRENLHYNGELRATGDILIDQYAFMLQCGFDAFELDDDVDLKYWKEVAKKIPATYTQTQTDDYAHIWSLRQQS